MKIGFDAKRAFHNTTGLGNYSRTLIGGLAKNYPGHQYYLFNPKPSALYQPFFKNVHEIRPSGINKIFSSLWRSSRVKNDLHKIGIDLYHGLSHEIPLGIEKTKTASVVTIHDLIFERYPEQFTKIDVRIYREKFQNACNHANRVIAVSKQTKQDIIDLYKISASKIDLCYTSYDAEFGHPFSEEEKNLLRKKYGLPSDFFLYVGSIIERKNLLNVCKAMVQIKEKTNLPLIVVGNGKGYKEKVKNYISETGLYANIIFLSEKYNINKQDLAIIYQMSVALIYPSFFEGFGLPVLEALAANTPVITSNVSCLPEAGGHAAYYVDPSSSEEIAKAMLDIYSDEGLRSSMIEKGRIHAQNFTIEKNTAAVMGVYNKIFDERIIHTAS